jgi:hypothetical protein
METWKQCVRSERRCDELSLGPSPPTRNRTFGKSAHIRGAVAASRSMPLRYANRERNTIVTRLDWIVSRRSKRRKESFHWCRWVAAAMVEIALVQGCSVLHIHFCEQKWQLDLRRISQTALHGGRYFRAYTKVNQSPCESVAYTYPVWETQMTASTFLRDPAMSLLVRILAASSKPKRLWSVKTDRTPNKCEWSMPSWPRDERLAWA